MRKIELKPEHLDLLHANTVSISEHVLEIMAAMQSIMKSAPNDILLCSYNDIVEKLDLVRSTAIRNRQELEAEGEVVDPEQQKKLCSFSKWANTCWRKLAKMAGKIMGPIKTIREFKTPASWNTGKEHTFLEWKVIENRPRMSPGPWITVKMMDTAFHRLKVKFEKGNDAIRDIYQYIQDLETMSGFPKDSITGVYPYVRAISQCFNQIHIILELAYWQANNDQFQYYEPDSLIKEVYIDGNQQQGASRKINKNLYTRTPLGKLFSYSKTVMSSAVDGMNMIFDLYKDIPDGIDIIHDHAPEIPRKVRIVYINKGGPHDQNRYYQDPDRLDPPPPPTGQPPGTMPDPRVTVLGKPARSRNPLIPEWYDELPWFGLRCTSLCAAVRRIILKCFDLTNALPAGYLMPIRT